MIVRSSRRRRSGVGEDVDGDDPAVPDGDAADRERPSVARGDEPGGAVDERAVHDEAEPRIGLRLAGSVRLSRSQASWTASSASLSEPSIR